MFFKILHDLEQTLAKVLERKKVINDKTIFNRRPAMISSSFSICLTISFGISVPKRRCAPLNVCCRSHSAGRYRRTEKRCENTFNAIRLIPNSNQTEATFSMSEKLNRREKEMDIKCLSGTRGAQSSPGRQILLSRWCAVVFERKCFNS
jgi:hypothetical protein